MVKTYCRYFEWNEGRGDNGKECTTQRKTEQIVQGARFHTQKYVKCRQENDNQLSKMQTNVKKKKKKTTKLL